MTERRRILLVKPILPYPPDQGTRVVSTAILDALADSYDVTVLARILSEGERRHVAALEARGIRVVTVFPANRRSRAARVGFRLAYTLHSLFTGRSMKSLYDCPGAFVSAARALASEPFDLVILEYWQLAPLLRVFGAGRTVLLTHDIDLLVNAQRALLETGLMARAAATRRVRTERGEEVRAYRAANNVWALTTRDADAVRILSRGRARVSVLPFGLDEARFAGEPAPRTSREVLFVGAMGAA
ncbi:MAG TPA: glycosyltransferase, partial [Candidatus Krumholzibacteria bacterium]|nr:glycosyltransferase [Candidatus Krumholzibacteria bacterium]